MSDRPLAIDLFCGLGGWAEGLIAEGWDVIGFDLERHEYGDHRYPATLVLQDVLTLDGTQFRDADLVVASPPCQFFSYCAMPWTRAKALAAEVRADPARLDAVLALFRACFRIQAEASTAAGRHIPLVVENVRGAQPWVGRARWNFGSFYLWGDIPALMPFTDRRHHKIESPHLWLRDPARAGGIYSKIGGGANVPGIGRTGFAAGDGVNRRNRERAIKNNGGSWLNVAHNTTSGKGRNLVVRKAASALIAKIPLPLARHIGRVFRPPAFAGAGLDRPVRPEQPIPHAEHEPAILPV